MKRVLVLVVVVGLGIVGMAAAGLDAQGRAGQPGRGGPGRGAPLPGPEGVRLEKIANNLYVITGAGGNVAAFVASGGVVLVDTMFAGWGQAILDRLKTVTDKPVTHIINTHTHGDHTGSNGFFADNVEIVAHENAAASMAKDEALRKRGLPKTTYKDRLTLLRGDDAIDLYHFGPAHTNGDALVVFRATRVMHGGDLFALKGAPRIDPGNGGTALGYGDTVAKAAAGIRNVDRVITGHSTVMPWATFAEYADYNKAFVEAVRAARAAGKTADAAAADLVLPARFREWKSTEFDFAAENVKIIYDELARQR